MARTGIIDLNFSPQVNVHGTSLTWNPFRRGLKVYVDAAEYDMALTRVMARSKESHDLCCSVGIGDFIVPWLQRLYRHTEMNHKLTPKIQRILIRHLPYALIEELSRCGVLGNDFGPRLQSNISTLINDSVISGHGVGVEVHPWAQLPSFHGLLYSQDFLAGIWSIDSSGRLHVQTPLSHFTGNRFPDRLAAARRTFRSNP